MDGATANISRLVAFAQFLWRVRGFLLLVFVSLTATYVISVDYLDHRKERAAVLEKSHAAIKEKEGELVLVITKTTVLWVTGEPIPKDVLDALDAISVELYNAVGELNNPTAEAGEATKEFRLAIANLRNSSISYNHRDEDSIRALRRAIDLFDRGRNAYHTVIERQIENYYKTVLGML